MKWRKSRRRCQQKSKMCGGGTLSTPPLPARSQKIVLYWESTLSVQLCRFAKQDEADYEHHREDRHSQIGHARDLGDKTYQEGSHKGCSLAENVVEAKIFA